jgi:hypothetical protein
VYGKDSRDLKAFSQNDVRGCFKAQKTHMEQYVTSEGNHFTLPRTISGHDGTLRFTAC